VIWPQFVAVACIAVLFVLSFLRFHSTLGSLGGYRCTRFDPYQQSHASFGL
jgi:hypothetical protein